MKRRLLIALIACLPLAAQEEAKHATEAKESAAEHQEGAHPEGDPLAVWKWANFAILAAGLGYLAVKGLGALFRNRSQEISKGIAEARAMKQDAENQAAEIGRRFSALGSEVEKIRAASATEIEREGERIRQQTAAAIARIEQQAAAEIESASKTARRELREYATHLALDLAAQRLRSRMDPAAENALVDGFVRDLSREGTRN